MGEAGRRCVEEQYAADAVVPRLEEFLSSVPRRVAR
jgi:hypothetical protein